MQRYKIGILVLLQMWQVSVYIIDLTKPLIITNWQMCSFLILPVQTEGLSAGSFSIRSPVSWVGWMHLDQWARQMGIPQVHLKGYGAEETVLLIYIKSIRGLTVWKKHFNIWSHSLTVVIFCSNKPWKLVYTVMLGKVNVRRSSLCCLWMNCKFMSK